MRGIAALGMHGPAGGQGPGAVAVPPYRNNDIRRAFSHFRAPVSAVACAKEVIEVLD